MFYPSLLFLIALKINVVKVKGINYFFTNIEKLLYHNGM